MQNVFSEMKSDNFDESLFDTFKTQGVNNKLKLVDKDSFTIECLSFLKQAIGKHPDFIQAINLDLI